MKRFISLCLCLLMALALLPAAAWADDRTVISTIVATSNVDQLPVCGQEIQAPTFTVTQGSPARFSTNMGYWSKKEGENWVRYDSGVFTPGTWRYYTQFRIDGSSGTTHVLATNPTVRVNGVAWTVVGTSSVGTNYSYNNARSPEYTVTDNGEFLFAVPGSVKISSCYVNETITSFSVAGYVSGGTAPYTFSKSAESTCPSWVKVSSTGTVSGTPTEPYGRASSLVIRVTDRNGNYKEASITVSRVALRYEDKTKISSIVATSNIGSILVNTGTIQAPTFTVTQGSPAYINTNMGYWQKKNGDTWAKQTSGTFTPGTWRYYVQFRVDGEDGVTYTLDKTNVTVKVDGDSWTVSGNSTIDDFFSYNNAYSPEFTVTDELPIYAAAVTITAPAVGARPDYLPGLPSGAHYYSDSYNTSTYHNDVCWRNMTTGPSLSVDTGVFEAGCSYQVIVYLTADDGYFFTDTATGTVNGNAADTRILNGQLELKYTFPALLSKPVIITQPQSVTAAAGATATFHVEASGTGLSYQWQWSKSGSAWRDCGAEGYDTDTFSFPMVASYSGRKYRCVVSNAAGSATSNAATLTLAGNKPIITTQPQNVSAAPGATVTFKVTATGATKYQWQYSKDGATWNNCGATGYDEPTFSFPMVTSYNGRKYRCIVSNSTGSTVSNTATLTLASSKPTITAQPQSVTAEAGATVTFKVTATGATSYQWQFSKDGATWNNCGAEGYDQPTFSFPMATSYNGRKYRCVVSNAAGSVTSSAATLTLSTKPKITAQPQNVTAAAGATVTFKVTATGATKYQWQYSKDGATWNNCGAEGYDQPTFSFPMAASYNGRKYRCIVSNAGGSVTSSAATLTLASSKPTITAQPQSATAAVGATVTFQVTATGATKYQWQYSKDGGATWNNCGAAGYDQPTFSFTMAASYSGRKYRCVVSNASGSVTSAAVTLTKK